MRDATTRQPRSGREGRRLARCAPVGMVVLLAVSTVDGLTRGDGYQPLRHWVSLLSLGERAWLGTATLASCGALVVLGAIGLDRLLGDDPQGRWIAAALGALGAGLVVASVFPVDPVRTYPQGTVVTEGISAPARIHTVSGLVIYSSAVLVALAGVRWARGIGRPHLAHVARCCGAVSLTAVVISCVLVGLKGGGSWDAAFAGAFQRVALLAAAVWIVVMTRAAEQSSPPSTDELCCGMRQA